LASTSDFVDRFSVVASGFLVVEGGDGAEGRILVEEGSGKIA